MRAKLFGLVLVGAASNTAPLAQAQLLTHRDLSYAMAKTIVETAIDTCAAKGYAVSAVAVDRDGEVTYRPRCRFMAGFLAGGILDRYPNLRLCVLECGFGWLPFWVRRMDEQVSYVGRTAKLKYLPSEHFAAGRVFCNIEAHEHEPMFNMVTGALGDGVLMFGSDYPHYESWFPHSIDKILEWGSLGPEVRRKLFWENAARCFKQT